MKKLARNEDSKPKLSYQERMTLLKEYELSQKMHNYYGRLTWEIGSILVGGSLAGLALVISNIPRPSSVASIFTFAVAIMASIFCLIVRRYRDITRIHLVRCREIEACLGMKQHLYVEKAACKSFTVKRQDGEEEKIEKIEFLTGWDMVQILCGVLVFIGIVIALYYLLPC